MNSGGSFSLKVTTFTWITRSELTEIIARYTLLCILKSNVIEICFD